MSKKDKDKSGQGDSSDNVFIGSDKNDSYDGGGGNDSLDGAGGNDKLQGGAGNDIVLGGAGNDSLWGDGSGSGKGSAGPKGSGSGPAKGSHAGSGSGPGKGSHAGSGSGPGKGSRGHSSRASDDGSDYLDGGAGNDNIFAGGGADTAAYQLAENVDSHDQYDGGDGEDILSLIMSDEEYADPTIWEDIQTYLAILDEGSKGGKFHFSSFDLKVKNFETLQLLDEEGYIRSLDGGGTGDSTSVVVSLDISAIEENTDTSAGNVKIGDLSATNITDPVFSIVSGNEAELFVLSGTELFVSQGVSLNHEAIASYNLVIAATDDTNTGQTSISVTVTDVDEEPTAMDLSGTSVTEEAVAAAIGTLTVTDPDADTEPFGNYSFVVVEDERFTVNSAGVLSLAPGESLDHETEPSVPIKIIATSGSGQQIVRTFDISVDDVDETPTSISLSAAEVDENTTGTTIGIVSVADVDTGPEYNTYTYVTNDTRFTVNNTSGALSLNTALDHETRSVVDVSITATSSGGHVISASFPITVNDVDEAPTELSLSDNEVDENAVAAAIGTVTVLDQDTDPAFAEYSFEVDDERFQVDAITGVLSLRAGVSLDFETEETVDVLVTATSAGGVIDTTFTIDVIDITEGALADGYISGATVFRDANANGVKDDGEIFATTDAKGDFDIDNGPGDLIAYGGTDISTGLPFKGQFTAPADSDVINPLTTLVKSVSDQNGGDVTAAEESVKAALGIHDDVDLATYDPLEEAANATDPAAAAVAVDVMAAAAKVANVLEQAAVVVTAAIGDASGSFDVETSNAVAEALAASIIGAGSDTVNLDSPGVIETVMVATAEGVAGETDSGLIDTIAAVAATAATVIASVNAEVTEAVENFDLTGDALGAVIEVVQVQAAVKSTEGVQQDLADAVVVVAAAVASGDTNLSDELLSVSAVAATVSSEEFEAAQDAAAIQVVVNEIRGTIEQINAFPLAAWDAIIAYNGSPGVEDNPVPIIVVDSGENIGFEDFSLDRLAKVSAVEVASGALVDTASKLLTLPSLSATGGSITLHDSAQNIANADLVDALSMVGAVEVASGELIGTASYLDAFPPLSAAGGSITLADDAAVIALVNFTGNLTDVSSVQVVSGTLQGSIDFINSFPGLIAAGGTIEIEDGVAEFVAADYSQGNLPVVQASSITSDTNIANADDGLVIDVDNVSFQNNAQLSGVRGVVSVEVVGSVITNSAGGSIVGLDNDGIMLIEGGGDVVNAGAIDGQVNIRADGVSGWTQNPANVDANGASARITNEAAGAITGVRYGLGMFSGATIDNAGSIQGSSGILVADEFNVGVAKADIVNTGTVTGNGFLADLVGNHVFTPSGVGIQLNSFLIDATVLNEGVISGSLMGINSMVDGTTITNQNGAVIVGNGAGTNIWGNDENWGVPGAGVRLDAVQGGVVTNDAFSTIYGESYGVLVSSQWIDGTDLPELEGGNTTVINDGTVTGATGDGVLMIGGGVVINSGTIESLDWSEFGGTPDGVSGWTDIHDKFLPGEVALQLDNLDGGLVSGASRGVAFSSGGVVNNDGRIEAYDLGVMIQAYTGEQSHLGAEINNSATGVIENYNADEPAIRLGGFLAAATIANDGTIHGAGQGIQILTDNVTVTNNGLIESFGTNAGGSDTGSAGISIPSGENVVINNSGDIFADQKGIAAEFRYWDEELEDVVVEASPVTINNSGLISALNNDGIKLWMGGTIVNTGTIEGLNETGRATDGIGGWIDDLSLDVSGTAGLDITNTGDGLSSGVITGQRAGIAASTGLILDNSGLVEGAGYGLFSQSYDVDGSMPVTNIANAGTIRSNNNWDDSWWELDHVGVAVFGEMESVSIVNSGTISGDDFAIFNSVGTTGMNLTNAGLIDGAIYNLDQAGVDNGVDNAPANNADVSDNIQNSGVVNGDVTLGLGDDVLNSATGTVNGAVMGGAGDDTITVGAEDNVIYGGSGANTITGGAGADTYAVKRSQYGHDIIMDFVLGIDKIDLSDIALLAQVNFGSLAAGDGSTDIHIDEVGGALEILIDLDDDGVVDQQFTLAGLVAGDIAALQTDLRFSTSEFVGTIAQLNALPPETVSDLSSIGGTIEIIDDAAEFTAADYTLGNLPFAQASFITNSSDIAADTAFTIDVDNVTLDNAALLDGGNRGVFSSQFGTVVINDTDASILGQNNDGVMLANGGDVLNRGSIEGRVSSNADGVSGWNAAGDNIDANGASLRLTNEETGSIVGVRFGAALFTGGNVNNAGHIEGGSGLLVADEFNSGISTADVTNSGTIVGTGDEAHLAGNHVFTPGGVGVQLNSFLVAASVDNSGDIIGSLIGINSMVDGTEITNQAGATVTGNGAGGNSSGNGEFWGVPGAGVRLDSTQNALVTNDGTIYGDAYGVAVTAQWADGDVFVSEGGNTTVNNTGTITGATQDGVLLRGGGSVINSGLIESLSWYGQGSPADGVSGWSDVDDKFQLGEIALQLDNLADGAVSGATRGVAFSAGGMVNNDGHIDGGQHGVMIQTSVNQGHLGAVLNNNASGVIENYDEYFSAVLLTGFLSDASVINDGVINGAGSGIQIDVDSIGPFTIDNTGTINSAGTQAGASQYGSAGISIPSGKNVVINNSGDIFAEQKGIAAEGTWDEDTEEFTVESSYVTVNNSGTISALNNDGIKLWMGGTVVNSGTIEGLNENGGATDGIGGWIDDNTLDVSGTAGLDITNTASGVISGQRGGITGSTAVVLVNDGLIEGAASGVLSQTFGVVGSMPVTSILNTGTIRSNNNWDDSWWEADHVGITIRGEMESVNIDNSGTISGEDYAIYNTVNTAGMQLTNTGLIDGVVFSLDQQAVDDGIADAPAAPADVSDYILNSGTITGFVELGLGDDTYDGAAGVLNGFITGGAGDDTLTLGAGDDSINGGTGSNTLTGGLGSDEFQVRLDENGHDTITDFDPATDRIDLSDFALQGLMDFNTLAAGDGDIDVDIQEVAGNLEIEIDTNDDGVSDHQLTLQGLVAADIAAVQAAFVYASDDFVGTFAQLNDLNPGLIAGFNSIEVRDSAQVISDIVYGVLTSPNLAAASNLVVENDTAFLSAAAVAAYPIPIGAVGTNPETGFAAVVLAFDSLANLADPGFSLGASAATALPTAAASVAEIIALTLGEGGSGALAGEVVLLVTDSVDNINSADFVNEPNLSRPGTVINTIVDTAAALYAAQQAGLFTDDTLNTFGVTRQIVNDTATAITNAFIAGEFPSDLWRTQVTEGTLWLPATIATTITSPLWALNGALIVLSGSPDELNAIDYGLFQGAVETSANYSVDAFYGADSAQLDGYDHIVLQDNAGAVAGFLWDRSNHGEPANFHRLESIEAIDGDVFVGVAVLDGLAIPVTAIDGVDELGEDIPYSITLFGSVEALELREYSGLQYQDAKLLILDTAFNINAANYSEDATLEGVTALVFDTVDGILNTVIDNPDIGYINYYQVSDSIANIAAADFGSGKLAEVVEVLAVDSADNISAAFGVLPVELTALAVNSGQLWIPPWAAVAAVLPITTYGDGHIRIADTIQQFIDTNFESDFNWDLFSGNVEIAVEDAAWNIEQAFWDGAIPTAVNTFRITEGSLYLPMDFENFLDGRAWYEGVGDPNGAGPWGEVVPSGSVDAINAADFNHIGGNYRVDVNDTVANVLAADFSQGNLPEVTYIGVNDDASAIAAEQIANGPLPNIINGVYVHYNQLLSQGDVAEAVQGTGNTFSAASGVSASVNGYSDSDHFFELPDLVHQDGFDRDSVEFGPDVIGDGRPQIDVSYDGSNTIINVYQSDDGTLDTSIILNNINAVDQINEYDFWGLYGGEQEPLPADAIAPWQLYEDPSTWPATFAVQGESWQIDQVIDALMPGGPLVPFEDRITELRVTDNHDYSRWALDLAAVNVPVVAIGQVFDGTQYVPAQVFGTGGTYELEGLAFAAGTGLEHATPILEGSVSDLDNANYLDATLASALLRAYDTPAAIHGIGSMTGADPATVMIGGVVGTVAQFNDADADPNGWFDPANGSRVAEADWLEIQDDASTIANNFGVFLSGVQQVTVISGELVLGTWEALNLSDVLGLPANLAAWGDGSIRITGDAAAYINDDVANQFDYGRIHGNWHFEVEDAAWNLEPMFYEGTLPEWSSVVVTEGTLFLDLRYISHPNFFVDLRNDSEVVPYGSIDSINDFDLTRLGNDFNMGVHDTVANVFSADFNSGNLPAVDHVIVVDDASVIALAAPVPSTVGGHDIHFNHQFHAGEEPAFTAQAVGGAHNTFVVPANANASINGFTDQADFFEFPDLVWTESFDRDSVVFGPNVIGDSSPNIDVQDVGGDTVITLYQDEDGIADASITLVGQNIASQINEYDFQGLYAGEQEPLPADTIAPFDLINDPSTWPDLFAVQGESWQIDEVINALMPGGPLVPFEDRITELRVTDNHDYSRWAPDLAAINVPVVAIGQVFDGAQYVPAQVFGTGGVGDLGGLAFAAGTGLENAIPLLDGPLSDLNADIYADPTLAAAVLRLWDSPDVINGLPTTGSLGFINAEDLEIAGVIGTVGEISAAEAASLFDPSFGSRVAEADWVEIQDTAANIGAAAGAIPAVVNQTIVIEGQLDIPVGFALGITGSLQAWEPGSIRIYGSASEFVDSDAANTFNYDVFSGNWHFEVEDAAWNLEPMFYDGTLPEWSSVVVTEGTLFLDLRYISHPNFFVDLRNDSEVVPYGSIDSINGFDLGRLGNDFNMGVHDTVANVFSADFNAGNLPAVDHVIVVDDASVIAAAAPLPATAGGMDVHFNHQFYAGEPAFTAEAVLGASNTFVVPANANASINGFTDQADFFEFPDLVWTEGFDRDNVVFGPNDTGDDSPNIDVQDVGGDTVITLYQDEDGSADASITLVGQNIASQINEYDFQGLYGGEQEPLLVGLEINTPNAVETVSADIIGPDTGVSITASDVMLTNDAYIEGVGSDYNLWSPTLSAGVLVYAQHNTTITNSVGATIFGSAYGVAAAGDGGAGEGSNTTIHNHGTIQAEALDAVQINGGGIVTNYATGVIENLNNIGGTPDGVAGWSNIPEKFAAGTYALTVVNSGTITANMRGVGFSTGGDVDNSGTITGSWAGVMIQDIPSVEEGRMPARVVNSSTGIIGVDGANPDGAGLRFAGYLSEIIVTNQGDISGVGNAVENFSGHIGLTLTNQVGGTITGDTDGVNGGAAIQSTELWDIQVTGWVNWLDADTPVLTTFNAVDPVAPLLDGSGNFITDGFGNPVFPDVDLSAYGVGTVTFVADENGTYFGEDGSGNPVYYYPDGSNFTDTIINDGVINGDVSLGIGNDSFSSTGTVNGDIRGGPGDDVITADDTNQAMFGGEGNDTLTGGAGLDWLEGGAGTDILSGGTGSDIFTYNLRSEFGDTITDFETTTDAVLLRGAIFGSLLHTGTVTFSTPTTPTGTNSTPTSLFGVNMLKTFLIGGASTLVPFSADTTIFNNLSVLGNFASSTALISAVSGLVMKVNGTATTIGTGIAFAMIGSDLKMFTISNVASATITAGEIGTLETIATFSNGATPDLILI